MDYHFTRRVRLRTDSEYPSLYNWSLEEVSSEGPQVSRALVPWVWSQYFHTCDLEHTVCLEFKEDHAGESKAAVSDLIRGTIRPHHRSWRDRTTYSMFGTNRTIESFDVRIQKVSADQPDSCSLWGSVSYTSDLDFEDVTEPDCVQIYIYLEPEKFDALARRLPLHNGQYGLIRLGRVHGFYSDWSPSIRTDNVKILESETYKQIEAPEGCQITPPILGEVGEFSITIGQKTPLEDENLDSNDKSAREQLDPVDLATEPQRISTQNRLDVARIEKATRKLLIPLWMLVFFLGLGLLR